jgi:endonuclease YncB( thermonuclease family)
MSLLAVMVFVCTPIAVYDGDGPIHCREGQKLRIAGIAAREIDGGCRPGHPCPRSSGIAARDALVNLLGGPRGRWKTGHITVRYGTMRCHKVGRSYDRVVARCTLNDGRDLGRAMIATATATATVLPWRPRGS